MKKTLLCDCETSNFAKVSYSFNNDDEHAIHRNDGLLQLVVVAVVLLRDGGAEHLGPHHAAQAVRTPALQVLLAQLSAHYLHIICTVLQHGTWLRGAWSMSSTLTPSWYRSCSRLRLGSSPLGAAGLTSDIDIVDIVDVDIVDM